MTPVAPLSDAACLRGLPDNFGLPAGPRCGPGGEEIAYVPTDVTRLIVSFLADEVQLKSYLPGRLSLRGEPLVSFEFVCLRNIHWLAGRGYNYLSVRIPVTHEDRDGSTAGSYMPVLWENLAEPILTGREQLGYPKIYASLPEPRRNGQSVTCEAAWDTHRFFEMTLEAEADPQPEDVSGFFQSVGSGLITVRHDRLGEVYGLTPFPSASATRFPLPPPKVRVGTGFGRFLPATFAQMPTQFHIVSALAKLQPIEPRPAYILSGPQHLDSIDHRWLSRPAVPDRPWADGQT